MDFGRVLTAMVTPFDANLQVNWDQTAALIDYLIEVQQTDSLIICGTTGESATLSDEEKLALFDFSLKQARGRCKIIAGTGSNHTAHTIHLTQQAERLGVDGILAVVPYYIRPSDEGLLQHFKAVAESTALPIIVYNIPGRTGVNMSVKTTIALSEIPNIVATKESHSDFDQLTRIVEGASEGFRVYSGDDSLALPALAVGCHGVISVASHIVGSEIKKMVQSYLDGKVAEAARLHRQLSPVFKGMFECPHRVPSPAPVKYALRLKGFDVGGVRLPLVEVNDAEAQFIRELLKL